MCDVVASTPNLEGRTARCGYYGKKTHNNECPICTRGGYCACERPSSMDLAFFEHNPAKEYDSFYCGCASWN
jgi:hypothetical protein